MIVADTNLIVYLLLTGERTEQAERIFQIDPDWISPLLWRSEFRSVLAQYVARKRLKLAEAVQIAEKAEDLMQGSEYAVSSTIVLRLAEASSRSAYHCEFIALAQLQQVPLVTTDGKLQRSFPANAISPEQFLEGDVS